jgi:hypothetical protein
MLALLLALVQDSQTLEITVEAGRHDRVHTPVRTLLTVKDALRGPVQVRLADGAGGILPAQLGEPDPAGGAVRPLHFILPSLKAGASAVYTVTITAGTATDPAGFRWKDTPGEHAELSHGARPVLRYVYPGIDESSKEARERTYKVFHHLYDPAGRRLVTKGAGGQFTHHRGLFYGFNKVEYGDGKKCDVWHCTGDAHQAHRQFFSSEAGPVLGRHTLEIGWHGPGKELFAREERRLTVFAVPGGTLVEFDSRLHPLVRSLKLDGDPQHAGFHFRADNEVSAKTAKQTVYIRPDGAGKAGETRNWPAQKDHVDLPWNAMSFVLGEQRYTAAYLDHPSNPKPARFSERDYGRTGSYFVHEFEKDDPLRVTYRIWLQEGQMKPEEIAARSADFVDPPKVTHK